jgi:hypothetical protein
MLHILGRRQSALCDGHSRRQFLKIGGLAMGGLSLPQILQAEQSTAGTAGKKLSHKAVIMIYLSGGPSHQDMYDLKMDAPPEIRGSFKPIATNVPGIEICEHMPKLATMMDKFAIIRSMDAGASNHTPITFQAANPKAQRSEIGRQGGGYPSMGSVAAKFKGPNRPGMPPFVALANSMVADVYGAGDLGQQYEPLDGMRVDGKFSMPKGVEVPRLQDRDLLRRELDRFRRNLDSSVSFQQQDRYTQEAYDLVLGGAAQKAFNLTEESDEVRNRYGRDSFGDKSLLARRLVEAGVTFVTMSDARSEEHTSELQSQRN